MITKSFKELFVWQKAPQFVLAIYKMTESFPKEELFVLTSRFRRAVVFVPANIAEEYRKRSKADKARFLIILVSSLEECKYYLLLAEDLEYAKTNKENKMAEEVSKLLNVYSNKIQSADYKIF